MSSDPGVDAVRYDIDPRHVPVLVDEIATGLPARSGDRLVVVAGRSDSAVGALARTVERDVFGAEFGNGPGEMAAEYGPYEDASVFLLVVDLAARRPAGVMRLLVHSPAGLKAVNDLEGHLGITPDEFLAREGLHDLDSCLEIATFAVHPRFRGWVHRYRVSLLLYRALFLQVGRGPQERIVAIMDGRALGSPTAMGVPWRPVAGTGSFAYLGSPDSYAIIVPIAGAEAALRERATRLRSRCRVSARTLVHPGRLLRRRLTLTAVEDLVSGRHLDPAIHLTSLAGPSEPEPAPERPGRATLRG